MAPGNRLCASPRSIAPLHPRAAGLCFHCGRPLVRNAGWSQDPLQRPQSLRGRYPLLRSIKAEIRGPFLETVEGTVPDLPEPNTPGRAHAAHVEHKDPAGLLDLEASRQIDTTGDWEDVLGHLAEDAERRKLWEATRRACSRWERRGSW